MRQLSPSIRLKEYRAKFVAPGRCEDLAAYLRCIDPALTLLQSRQALTIAVDDLADQLAADNVIYAEIRFAPHLHASEQMSVDAVVETVADALQAAEHDYGIRLGLILCTLRHFPEEVSNEVAELVCRYADNGVIALDLAADEAGFSIDAHVAAFEHIHDKGLNAIAHAGEARGPRSVRECVNRLHVSRIGHGVRSIEDASTIELLQEKDIHLEICPTSNLHTNVYGTYPEHPVNALWQHGVSVGINTDARTVSNVTLSSEYAVLEQAFAWTTEQFLTANQSALNACFLSPEDKRPMNEALLQAYCD